MVQLKKTIFFIFTVMMLLSGLLVKPVIVKAENTINTANTIDVIVPLNHTEMPDLIKNQILESLTKTDKNIDLKNIDFEKTSISIDEFIDNSSIGTTSANVLLNIVNIHELASVIYKPITLKVNIEVVDITEPELVLTKDAIDVAINDVFDPWAYVEYAYDNSSIYPTVAILNNVDTSKAGKYEVIFAASDESGNRYETTLKVNVTKNAKRISNVVYSGDDIQYMLDLINTERSNLGLSPLTLADENGQMAVGIRANEAAGYLSHTRPDGSHYKTALTENGVTYANSPLEVLTYAGNSVEAKFNWWMSSKNHRAILMSSGNYSTIAIGYNGRMWCAIVY